MNTVPRSVSLPARHGLLLTLLLLSGCLPGPDSSLRNPQAAKIESLASRFETPEYHAQRALARVKASTLYALGGTGRGVSVAIIDSGLNTELAEFKGRLDTSGHDYVRNLPELIDPHGHGTQMAGIVAANRDGQGMHGIAFDAKLIAMRIGDNNEPFFFDEQIAHAWKDSFAAGARILSNSWANAIPATQITEARYKQVMGDSLRIARQLVADGAVFVFPTGNELRREPLAEPGLPLALPELERGWIAVVALSNDGTVINQKSNYCGVAERWCIAVPGGDGGVGKGLLTTTAKGGYTETAGTSPAVALVSGALAALQSRFPELTPQQLREVLLNSANNSGIYAKGEAYGRGLMDLAAAAQLAGERVKNQPVNLVQR
ncbi:S8 family peptidase [Pseudomonas agarici]|uniref:S8 family peptidase n=1 Tax=Pseudomonas agarici TaxID=46677 RepID=UPI000374AA9B|nr:S8 family peptidase [Pseudomonas agarici]NWB91231.1 S8 family serine peptidase [Pseudomonas agarici]NWC07998.1 S8 family serine peptidase [Pseudomonas agarici]SEL15895.1 subtilase-type serine protease [Pseudomonas agarici]